MTPPPLSFTRPLPTGAEMVAVLAYLDWLGSEMTLIGAPGTPLCAFGMLLMATAAGVRASVNRGKDAPLLELASLAADWSGRQLGYPPLSPPAAVPRPLAAVDAAALPWAAATN